MQKLSHSEIQTLSSTAISRHVQQAHVMRAEIVAELFGILIGAVRRGMRSFIANRMPKAEA